MRMALQRFRLRGRTVQRNTKMRNPLAMKLQLVFFLAVITCSCSGFAVTDRSDRAVVQTSSREQRSSTEERPLKVKEQQSKVLSADRFVNFLLPGDDQQQQQQQQRPFVISMQTEKPPTEDSEKAKAEAGADDTSDESSPSTSSQTEKDSELLFKHRRRAQARASLMAKRDRGSSSESKSTGKDTSVGARRVGSATRSRQGGSATSQIWDAVRKTAQGASSASKNVSNNSNITSSLFESTASATQAPRISKSVVTTAIEDLLQSQGCIPVTAHSQSGTNQVAIRLATPHDDVDIANLRLSVFSDFHPDLQNQFCARSCQAIAARRGRGATCLVATAPSRSGSAIPGVVPASDVILGSAECSWHEFCGTRLGRRRPPQSIWYVTEVAVSPSARRRRIASQLLEAIDVLAQQSRIETLYLHVDVENCAALRLYEKAGYRMVHCNGGNDDDNQLLYREFTKSLNLHPGATKGREHFLLYKDIVDAPRWLDDSLVRCDSQDWFVQSSRSNELVGILGFEIPA